MDAAAFFGLEPTDDPLRFRLPVVPEISTGGGFLFGGCALGAAICGLERATGRSASWATGQYLSFARPPERVDIEIVVAAAGAQSTQARAICSVGDREILTVNAALGTRDFPDAGQWAEAPDVPPPDECPPRPSPWPTERTISARLEQRLVPNDLLGGPATATGRTVLWSRMPELLEISGAALAVLGDHVPMGIARALGRLGQVSSNSLDNTLRIVRIVPTSWVLLDLRVDAVHHGIGHGTVHLWSQDGTLMAVASQSAKVRARR